MESKKQSMRFEIKPFILAVILFGFNTSYGQSPDACCKAAFKENYNTIEKKLKRLVKKHQHGVSYYNGPGSGYQINLDPSLDSITFQLKSLPCVEDAYWDKCQMKIAIYPGASSIGVKFKTKQGITEKCFLIQEGTTGTVNVFGWRPKIRKARNILVYQKMYNCPNFIETQKRNCSTK